MGRKGKRIPDEAMVAPGLKAAEWRKFRKKLEIDSPASLWEEVWDSWYFPRLEGRFLAPAEAIAATGRKAGEGFTVTLILCVLIEFVEASLQGRLFCTSDAEDLGPFEYRSSRQLFVDFLTSEWKMGRPLSKTLAQDFFHNVRSGLVHEASTRSNALIRATQREELDAPFYCELVKPRGKWLVCHRDELLHVMRDFLARYKSKVVSGEGTHRENLFRILDHVCGLDRSLYFAYGSNMLREQLEAERAIRVHHSWNDVIVGGYKLAFNKRSRKRTDRTYANIVEAGSDHSVRGVLFEIDQEDLGRLHKEFEGGYDEATVKVRLSDHLPTSFPARTFIATGPNCSPVADPPESYVERIVRGAQAAGLPADYIARIEAAAGAPSTSAR